MDLKDRFIAAFGLKAADPAAFLAADAARLKRLNAEAADLYAASPKPALSQKERDRLAGKRSPILTEILRQMAGALSAHRDIARECQVTPRSCLRTADLDLAAARLVKTTGDVHRIATDGLRLVAAEANVLGEKVLVTARDHIQARDARVADPTVLETAFCEAFRLHQEAARRAARALARRERRVQPLREQADRARRRRAEAETMTALLSPPER